jgi:hypothetical protein
MVSLPISGFGPKYSMLVIESGSGTRVGKERSLG